MNPKFEFTKFDNHLKVLADVADIVTMPGFQFRESMSSDAVEAYTERYALDGKNAMPALMVVYDKSIDRLVVVDGHHRLEAAKRAGMDSVWVTRKISSAASEKEYAIEAFILNSANGVAPTRRERIAVAELMLDIHPEKSTREIASVTGISKSWVAELRHKRDAEKEKEVSTLDRPATEIHCGNAGCSLSCSPEYISDPDCDWVESDGVWYCGEECRGIARENRLEKQADAILEEGNDADETSETPDPEEADTPALRATPPKEQNHKCCPFCGEEAEVEIEKTSIGENFQVHCSNLDCEIWPRTQWKSNVAAAWEIWDTRKGE